MSQVVPYFTYYNCGFSCSSGQSTNGVESAMLFKVVLVVAVFGLSLAAELEEIFAWKEVEFQWPDAATKEEAIKSGKYIPENNLPLGIARWKNKLFVTVPRWKGGVGASLNYVPLDPLNKTAALIPYPDWKANILPEGDQKVEDNAIISVFRVAVDACDRLWVMDTGLADIFGEAKQLAKPGLVIFDLKTDKLIRRYDFKPTDSKEDSFFANVIIDATPDKCDEAFAYIPDLGGYGIVVYSFQENDSWRVKHNFFHFDPLKGDLKVGGVNFQWTDGVFGLALSKHNPDGFRTMYFHALASTKEFSVDTHVLRNKTMATDQSTYFLYKLEGERGDDTQATASDIDENTGVMFLTQISKDGIGCWNTKKPLNSETLGLVAQDHERLIFPNDLKVDNERNLFVLSDRMPVFLFSKLDSSQVNYRIFRIKVDDAIKGTPCE